MNLPRIGIVLLGLAECRCEFLASNIPLAPKLPIPKLKWQIGTAPNPLCSLTSPGQCRHNGLRPRTASIRCHAENDLNDLRPYLDSLHECANNLSPAVPVGVCQLWPDGRRQLAKALRCKSEVFQLIDIASVSLDLGVEISDPTLGSTHPRCELVFLNQSIGKAVDQPLQSVLQLEPLGLEKRDIV